MHKQNKYMLESVGVSGPLGCYTVDNLARYGSNDVMQIIYYICLSTVALGNIFFIPFFDTFGPVAPL